MRWYEVGMHVDDASHDALSSDHSIAPPPPSVAMMCGPVIDSTKRNLVPTSGGATI
jgi:hypothetical protein